MRSAVLAVLQLAESHLAKKATGGEAGQNLRKTIDTAARSEPVRLPAPEKTESDMEWEQLESVLAVRAALAEQVDVIGMQNLVRAYQHVRHGRQKIALQVSG
jgi:hypothetical protein